MRDASASAKLEAAKAEIHEMANNFVLSIIKDEYGYKEYSLHMENTTQYTFDYFDIDFNFLDENGNIADTGWGGNIKNWVPGQSADVDAWTSNNSDPSQYTISYNLHYNTADGTIYE